MTSSTFVNKMASQRFGNSTEDDLQRLLCDKDAKNTKKATKAALTCLMQFMLSTERDNLVLETPEQLNECLIKFYADARKKDGSLYKLSALKGLRFGLARHFLKEMDVDIIKDVRFKRANDIFKAVSVQLKREGLGSIDHTPSLDQQDLKKLYGSVAMKVDTPAGLLHKVWFDIMFHLCRRGRENLREMNKSTFAIQTDASGREYVFQARDELDKNHRENSDSCITEGRMYAVPGHPLCLVATFKKYLSKLNPKRDDLWQCPLNSYDDSSEIWYMNQVLGKNTLSTLMKVISRQAGLSQEFTNHSIRATSITVLDVNKFSDRDIMSVSGHRSETSIKNYTGKVTTKRKFEMSRALCASVINSEEMVEIVTLSQEQIEVEGEINLSQEQIDKLMEPMIDQNLEQTTVNVSVNVNADHEAQPQPANNLMDNALKPLENLPFTPMISNCNVTFNVNLISK